MPQAPLPGRDLVGPFTLKKDSNRVPACEELVLPNVYLKRQSSLFY